MVALALLTACGGGGGGGGGVISTPAPVPTPSPSPAPAPAPTPTPPPTTTNFDTAEYRRSDGPSYHGAATAWSASATGAGVKIAVIDTGIDTDNPEFAGRIDSGSADVAGNGTFEASDDHGTQVALVAAAARNNTGVVGIAYNASIVALRADSPGSCASKDDCVFTDTNIARGIDRAVAAGATVINLSLGGDAPSRGLLDSVTKASAAGVVLVVSAGNEGDGSDPDIDPNTPNPFAIAVRTAGGANVIIVGSVNEQGQFSAFSNKAGSQANYYLSALGERVCCVYENGVLKQTSDSSGTFVTLVSGTSFSAPQVSGAVALLKQAFPNLSGAQMVDLLLKSARDAGATGTDPIYGRGILDIAAAFAPRGATALAGSTSVVRVADDTGVASPAMGDAFVGGTLGAVVTDSYGRAYGYDLAQGLRRAAAEPKLLGAVDAGSRRIGAAGKTMALAFTVADGSRGGMAPIAPLRLSSDQAREATVLAARVAMKLAPGKTMGFAFRESPEGLVAQLQGREQAAFLIAGDARGQAGFSAFGDTSLAYRQQIGDWGLTASGGTGSARLGNLRLADGVLDRQREEKSVRTFSLAADRSFGAIGTVLGLTWLNEDRTVLGGYFHDAFGAGGANSLFIDAHVGWRFADGWRLGGAIRQGWTRADRVGLVSAGSNFSSRALSADLTRSGILGTTDTLGLRVSQPLRVEGGGLALNLPVDYSYATLSPTYGIRSLSLSPKGREIDTELAWQGALLGGNASASVFYRRDPGHVAALRDDKGVAVKWGVRF
ncbi:S8 family peptidase [Tsuneonella amylolytica]|uniref:S8 family peptidase n=1 Tax=Tsuneonella amylolytica TaxID=2338327 RepID=UPI000EAAC402|nr:S8 family peptidase [Tsuneonella amylolytica]